MDIPLDDEAMARRFWSYVDTITGQWTGYRDTDGYGIFTITGTNGRRVKLRAHRVAWALTNQTQPTGVIRHRIECSNPSCCNPDCLADGTQRQNIADRDHPLRRAARLRARLAAMGQRTLPLVDTGE